ncbi:MAG TPA: FkbM family methyltransferase [Patescibacteria group bacterium]|nr:FkbM family methyltransferase [Patescibacteria group bacterium]
MTMARRLRQARKLLALLRHPAFRRGLARGVAAGIENLELLRPLTIGSVIDVGANRGQFALLARTLFPQAPIHAFEPLREAADRFERLFAGDTLTRLTRCAIAAAAGSATMFVSQRPDNSSLLPISAAQVRFAPGTQHARDEVVTVERLDDMVVPADLVAPVLLKLDVQGGELAVLRGAEATLGRCDMVLAEVSFEELYAGQPLAGEIVAVLQQHGFQVIGAGHAGRDASGRCLQIDLLFGRNRR